MNLEIKEQWVAALRSGKFKQAKYKLKENEGYCCLGVLCSLAEKENVGQFKAEKQYGAKLNLFVDHAGGESCSF
jgi:hypothetical protein